MQKYELDNMTGQDIKEMIDDRKIELEELDYSSLLKVFDYETDMIVFGTGDMDFINKCSELLEEKQSEPIISDERFDEIIAKTLAEEVTIITNGEKATRGINRPVKHVVLRKIAVVAAIITVIFATTTLVAAAFGINVFEYVAKLVRLDGEVIEENGITFYASDETKEYDSIEELLESENLDILYPTKLPDGVYITKVKVDKAFNGNDIVAIFTNSKNICVRIELDSENIPTNNEDVYKSKNMLFYIGEYEEYVFANSQYQNDKYYISANSRDELILIIDNIKEK